MFDKPEFLVATIIAVLIFVGYLIIDVLISKKQRVKRIQEDVKLEQQFDDFSYSADSYIGEGEQQYSASTESLEQMMRAVGVDVDNKLPEARKELLVAGIQSPFAIACIVFYRRILSFIIAFIGLLLLLKGTTLSLAVGALLVVVGLFGAKLYISNSKQKRQKALIRSFPDGLDLLVICVESGLALDAAMSRVCNELSSAHPLLAKELNQTRLELALLNDRSRALMNLAERTDLIPYRSLVAALIQTEKFGTNLTDTLRVLSDDYRQTRLMLAEEKAGRLPALMTIPLLIMLMPALFLVIMGPVIIRVKENGGILPE